MEQPATVEGMVLLLSRTRMVDGAKEVMCLFSNGAVYGKTGSGDTRHETILHVSYYDPEIQASFEHLRQFHPSIPFPEMNRWQQKIARKCFAWSVV